jgi:hypothetical protein
MPHIRLHSRRWLGAGTHPAAVAPSGSAAWRRGRGEWREAAQASSIKDGNSPSPLAGLSGGHQRDPGILEVAHHLRVQMTCVDPK